MSQNQINKYVWLVETLYHAAQGDCRHGETDVE